MNTDTSDHNLITYILKQYKINIITYNMLQKARIFATDTYEYNYSSKITYITTAHTYKMNELVKYINNIIDNKCIIYYTNDIDVINQNAKYIYYKSNTENTNNNYIEMQQEIYEFVINVKPYTITFGKRDEYNEIKTRLSKITSIFNKLVNLLRFCHSHISSNSIEIKYYNIELNNINVIKLTSESIQCIRNMLQSYTRYIVDYITRTYVQLPKPTYNDVHINTGWRYTKENALVFEMYLETDDEYNTRNMNNITILLNKIKNNYLNILCLQEVSYSTLKLLYDNTKHINATTNKTEHITHNAFTNVITYIFDTTKTMKLLTTTKYNDIFKTTERTKYTELQYNKFMLYIINFHIINVGLNYNIFEKIEQIIERGIKKEIVILAGDFNIADYNLETALKKLNVDNLMLTYNNTGYNSFEAKYTVNNINIYIKSELTPAINDENRTYDLLIILSDMQL